MSLTRSGKKKRNYLGSIGGILLSSFSVLMLAGAFSIMQAHLALFILFGILVVQLYLTYLKIVEFKTSAAVIQLIFNLSTIGVTLIFGDNRMSLPNAAQQAGADLARIVLILSILLLFVDIIVTYARSKNTQTVNYQDIYG